MVNNILAHNEDIRHTDGTYFNRTFSLTQENLDTGVETDFTLTDYSGLFTISRNPTSAALYSKTTAGPELTFSGNDITIVDNIDLTVFGELYFQLKITHSTDSDKVYIVWFGKFVNLPAGSEN